MADEQFGKPIEIERQCPLQSLVPSRQHAPKAFQGSRLGCATHVPTFAEENKGSTQKFSIKRFRGCGLLTGLAACFAILIVAPFPSEAQAQPSDDAAYALAARSSIVVLGTVTQVRASQEPLLAPTSATVVIKITRMFAGSEFAGDQTGRTATIILSKPGGVNVGTEAFFFGNPRFIGKAITIADEGELPAPRGAADVTPPGIAQGLQARADAPVNARLALADLVFRGTVQNVRPLQAGEANGPGRDEHDPDWQLALVQVTLALRGTQTGAIVPVVFPGSRDIVWFNSPKVRPGEQVLFLAHRPQEDELRLFHTTGVLRSVEEQHAVVVSQPFDVLPTTDETRILGLLQTKGGR